jgi:hypothetical protein
MKKIILFIILCYGSAAMSQDTTWTKSDAKIWGSKEEKKHQDLIGVQSNNRSLCRFIGFKEFYEQNISMWLQLNYGFSLDDSNNGKNGSTTYILTKNGVYLGTKPRKLFMTFNHDKDHRITSGKIVGSFNTLATIFIYYWPQDPVWASIETLKPGVAAAKHSYGDLISFKWINGQPLITITKDPNFIMPVQ